MNGLRQLLDKRRPEIARALSELRDKRAEIEGQIKTLEREAAELDSAAKAIGIVTGIQIEPRKVTARKQPKITIQDAVLAILSANPNGLIALDILKALKARFQLEILRSSLSPQLTRLKRRGKLTKDGLVWRLTLQDTPRT